MPPASRKPPSLFAVACLSAGCGLALPTTGVAGEPVLARIKVEASVEVATGASRTIKLDPREGAATGGTICNRSQARGQYGLVMPVDPPPPVAVRFLEPGECRDFVGAWDVGIWGRPSAWTAAVTFR